MNNLLFFREQYPIEEKEFFYESKNYTYVLHFFYVPLYAYVRSSRKRRREDIR